MRVVKSELSAVDRRQLEILKPLFANPTVVEQIDALLSGARKPLSFESLAGFRSTQLGRRLAGRRSVA